MTTPRAIRQYLEGLQRAGLSAVPVMTADQQEALEAIEPEQASEVAPAPELKANEASSANRDRRPTVQESSDAELFPAPVASAVALPQRELIDPDDRPPRCTLSADDRQAELTSWAERVAACTRCPELARTRTQTVFGVGNPAADVMFIGEAPGADEDRQGEPFVGRAGELLDKITEACQLSRAEIYICNILRCRPPGNRNPRPEEASACREYLDAQIGLVDPDWIICWGSVAARNLLGVETAIGRMRQQEYRYGNARVYCTYHPSYLLRNPSAKKKVWDDMKLWRRQMGVEL